MGALGGGDALSCQRDAERVLWVVDFAEKAPPLLRSKRLKVTTTAVSVMPPGAAPCRPIGRVDKPGLLEQCGVMRLS
jgi:hypothetical protein